jgi:serine/threonine protein phosphatase 1
MDMLKQINFKDTDIMYIIGDAIDRGKYPIRTLLYIIDHPNMKMLLGNHEEMMLQSEYDNYFNCWMYNGGEVTLNQYSGLCKQDREKIDDYLQSLPLTLELDNYILVHAGITRDKSDREFCIWAREEFLEAPTNLRKTIIFGHTPTYFIVKENPMSIWHGDGRIGIDCGACFTGGRLGCIRLEDLKEFYI